MAVTVGVIGLGGHLVGSDRAGDESGTRLGDVDHVCRSFATGLTRAHVHGAAVEGGGFNEARRRVADEQATSGSQTLEKADKLLSGQVLDQFPVVLCGGRGESGKNGDATGIVIWSENDRVLAGPVTIP